MANLQIPDYQPAWLTDELNKLLAAIGGHDQRKKRTTVLRLAEAAAVGRTETDTFKLPDTCSWKTWDGQYRKGKKRPGWRHDPEIQDALKAATARALWYQDQAEARRIAQRQEKLAEARDLLAQFSPMAVRRLQILMEEAESEETRRRSANDILDRADEGTAAKSVTTETGEHAQRIKLDLTDLPAELLQALAGLGVEGDAGGGGQGGTE